VTLYCPDSVSSFDPNGSGRQEKDDNMNGSRNLCYNGRAAEAPIREEDTWGDVSHKL